MSRVGNVPVAVPDGVDVTVDGRLITAKGKLGELSYQMTEVVTAALDDGSLVVAPVDESKQARAMWGTTRSLVQSLVTGVSEGFTKQLEINGVGYRATVLDKNTLGLQLGYSHDINYAIPEGITITCEKPTSITDVDEVVLRKEGKKK
jgi:large subunit ribosomal protein L6